MYIVKVDENYVPYDIGQSKNLGGRLRSDIVELLGGQRYLYEPERLTANAGLVEVHRYCGKDWNSSHIACFAERSRIAYENLRAFEIWWTPVLECEPGQAAESVPQRDGKHQDRIRRAAESCLQNAEQESGISKILQFARPELHPESCLSVTVHSDFPQGVVVLGIPPVAAYGLATG